MLGLAGCGGDTTAACDTIQKELRNITTTGMQQTGDVNALAKTYKDGAARIRSAGADAGGDVESAANDTAKALEDMGTAVTSGSTQMPDPAPLTNAGIKLKEACA